MKGEAVQTWSDEISLSGWVGLGSPVHWAALGASVHLWFCVSWGVGSVGKDLPFIPAPPFSSTFPVSGYSLCGRVDFRALHSLSFARGVEKEEGGWLLC